MRKKLTEKQRTVLAESAIGVMLFVLSIWSVQLEFGWTVFNRPFLIVVMLYFGILGYVLFRMRWLEAKKKSPDEKIDELTNTINALIQEIRQERDERNRKSR